MRSKSEIIPNSHEARHLGRNDGIFSAAFAAGGPVFPPRSRPFAALAGGPSSARYALSISALCKGTTCSSHSLAATVSLPQGRRAFVARTRSAGGRVARRPVHVRRGRREPRVGSLPRHRDPDVAQAALAANNSLDHRKRMTPASSTRRSPDHRLLHRDHLGVRRPVAVDGEDEPSRPELGADHSSVLFAIGRMRPTGALPL